MKVQTSTDMVLIYTCHLVGGGRCHCMATKHVYKEHEIQCVFFFFFKTQDKLF